MSSTGVRRSATGQPGLVRPSHAVCVAGSAFFVAVVLVLVGAGDRASAHAFLVRTQPASGARLDRAPTELVLEFTEALPSRPSVAMRTIAGRPIVGLRPIGPDDPATVRVGLPSLGPGVYVVAWVGDAEDGHRSEGTWAFAVGDVAGVSIPAARQTQEPGSPAVTGLTWLALLTIAAAVAGAFRSATDGSRPQSLAAGFLVPGVAVALLVSRTVVMVGFRTAIGLDNGPVSKVAALGIASVAFASAGWLTARRPMVGVAFFAASSATVAASGHVIGPGVWWGAVATVVHAVLGLWWLASLIGVLVVAGGEPAALRRRIDAHSRRASVIVPIAVLGGVLTSIARIQRWSAVTGSSYGRWTIAKTLVVVAALAVAWTARRRLRRIDSSSSDASASPDAYAATITRSVAGSRWQAVLGVEILLLLGAVGLGTVLSAIAPPPELLLVELGPSPVPAPATTRAVLSGNHLLVATAGTGRLQVLLLAAGSQPPLMSTVLSVRGVEPDGTEVGWQPRRCGTGCIEVDHEWRNGTTVVHVNASGSDGGNAVSRLEITWPPVDASGAADGALRQLRAAAMVHVVETDSSGPGATSAPYPLDVTGKYMVEQSPYPQHPTNVTWVDDGRGGCRLQLWLPGSSTWIEMHIDRSGRLMDDVIIDPGHRIERIYTYP